MGFTIVLDSGGLRPILFYLTMAKSRIKTWAERHALLISFRFFLTAFWPMAFIGLAMMALAILILVIALVPDVPVA